SPRSNKRLRKIRPAKQSLKSTRCMLCELDEVFWDDLLNRVEEGEVIPIVGPGAVTFGHGDEILYPWLAGRLAAELTPRLQFDNPPSDLQAVVDAQRRAGQRIDRIYNHLH